MTLSQLPSCQTEWWFKNTNLIMLLPNAFRMAPESWWEPTPSDTSWCLWCHLLFLALLTETALDHPLNAQINYAWHVSPSAQTLPCRRRLFWSTVASTPIAFCVFNCVTHLAIPFTYISPMYDRRQILCLVCVCTLYTGTQYVCVEWMPRKG